MGTRIMSSGAEKVYAAAEKWVDAALRIDGSLFTPGKAIWSSRWLGELHERFLNHPDESSDSFLEKLQRQLANSPPEVYQLMGEVLYFHFLIVSTRSSNAEKRVIDTVLGWSPSPVEIPQELIVSLTPGIASPGTYFHTSRPFQIRFLIEFAEQWKELEQDELQRSLYDPWAFKDFVMTMPLRSHLLSDSQNRPQTQRLALLHLTHPDTFESIVSADHKEKIAKTFSHLVTQPTNDVDRQLEQIRQGLEDELGRDFKFYDDEIRRQWESQDRKSGNASEPWDEYVKRAKAYVDTGKLQIEEIEYKTEIGRKLAAAREAVLSGADNWYTLLKNGLGYGAGNPFAWQLVDDFNRWCAEHPEKALAALQTLWEESSASATERIRSFTDASSDSPLRGKGSAYGSSVSVISALLMGLDVEQYPPFAVNWFKEAYELTEYGLPESGAEEATLYEHALGFLDRFIYEAAKRGLELHHRLDAQSVMWALTKNRDDPLCDEEEPPADPWAQANIEALAGELLWKPSYLQKIIDGLKDKRQVIFQGPPGTGKTYVAKRIAEWCKQHGGDFRIVQFHPSYAYEDFVEGFRPTLTDGQAGFKLTKGPLRLITEKAENNPNTTFILVIDEINRGNVANVLGELYFLLEYRGENEKVGLQYSNDQFSLPKNLWFIGTMNTTDRSIALVDAALRRRFYFFGFFPDEAPIRGLLNRWLEENNPDAKWVADLVDLANRKLEDRHLGIGPSHFMKKDPPLAEDRVRFIWEQAVIPYIEEQCFGDEDKLKEFAYDRLKRELDGTASDPDVGSLQPEGTASEDSRQAEDGVGDASA